MDGTRPFAPDFDACPQWRWHSWKLGLDQKILFTELNEKYNTVPCHIQTNESFHLDVSSIILQAKDLDDFYSKLAVRRDQRLYELQQTWLDVIRNFNSTRPKVWGEKEDKVDSAFGRMTSDLSFETLICYIDAQTPNDAKYYQSMGIVDPEAWDDGSGQLQRRQPTPPPPPLPRWPPPNWPRQAPATSTPPEGGGNNPLDQTPSPPPPPPPPRLPPQFNADDDGSSRTTATATATAKAAAVDPSSGRRHDPNTVQGEEQEQQRREAQHLEDSQNTTVEGNNNELQPPATPSAASSNRRSKRTATLTRNAGVGSRSGQRSSPRRQQQKGQEREGNTVEPSTSATGKRNVGSGSRSRQHQQPEKAKNKRPRTSPSKNNAPTRKSRRVAGLSPSVDVG